MDLLLLSAAWFTVEFEGSDYCVGFSTGPDGAPTHWFQLRLLMRPPIAANVGQTVKARIKMVATQQQSYKIDGKLVLAGTEFSSTCKDVDLKVSKWQETSKIKREVSELALLRRLAVFSLFFAGVCSCLFA